jgi:hypothetical protein
MVELNSDHEEATFRLGAKLLAKILRACIADLDKIETEHNLEFAESVYDQVMHELFRIVRQSRPPGPRAAES